MPMAVLFFLAVPVFVFAMVALGTLFYAAFTSAPYAPTPRAYIREALKLAGLRSGEKFYDRGSGDGRALIIAAKEFGAEAVGIELSLFHFLLSKIKIRLNGAQNSIRVKWADFYSENLGGADVVFCWLTPKAFPKLVDKFNQELKAGARVITFSSQLKFWKPDKIMELPAQCNTWTEKIMAKFYPSFRHRIFLYIKVKG